MRTDWERLPFTDIVADESGGNEKTPQSEYLPKGRFPVVDQGKDLIAGYVNDETRLCRSALPVIVFGDHTRCFKHIDFPFCIGADGVKILRPKAQTDTKYLYHFLRSLYLTGGGYDRHFKYLKRSEVLLPPLEEQRRIADMLDRAEALRTKRRAALAHLDSLTQAIFLDLFGDPVVNAKRWDTRPLTEICHCYSGGTPSKANQKLWQGSLPWFSPKDLKQDDLFDAQDHVSDDVPNVTNIRLLPANTVVIVVRGMILAHTFPVSVLRVPATINQDLKALLPRIDVEPQFLAACLRAQASHALQQVSEAGHGTKRLDAAGLSRISIILPPNERQREFVHAAAAVERLRATHRDSLAKLDELFAALQYRAFRGEL